jgi:hypothetical protein
MITFDDLATKWDLSTIRNCPGRFIIRTPPAGISLEDLLGPDAEIQTFNIAAARDRVLIARIAGGGVISYSRADGTYLHTLNTVEGFERKLSDLGIELAN